MNVRIQQLNPVIGDIQGNTAAILNALREAEQQGMEMLILPELAVTGYPPMDLLERRDFLETVYKANENIIGNTGDTAVVFGSVTDNTSGIGRKCFNSAIVASNGEKIAEVHKTLLPTYDVFDDLRYFEPNEGFETISFKGIELGITICEDIWYNENDIQYHTYEVNPAAELARAGADVIINISASPFTKTKPRSRRRMLQDHAGELGLPVFYANQVGANTELIFDGDTMAISRDREVIARAPLFEESFIDIDWDTDTGRLQAPKQMLSEEPIEEEGIFRALVMGVRDYFRKTKLTDKAVLGLSGGIDSALVACIASEALGPENVMGVTMPSRFSSEGSVTDSERLAENLGIEFREISIHELFDQYLDVLEPLFEGTDFGVAEENLQSRIRGDLLMAISNKFGHMLLNSGNKSELATGYCTLYGDMAGAIGVIADVYKTEVYDIARWLNDSYYGREMIPVSILEKAPSAELRPDQRDSDTLPDYETLDAILMLYIEKQWSADEIREEGFEGETVEKVIRLTDRNEYKRFQAVPVLKVSTKAFGTGRRRPIVEGWTKNQSFNS